MIRVLTLAKFLNNIRPLSQIVIGLMGDHAIYRHTVADAGSVAEVHLLDGKSEEDFLIKTSADILIVDVLEISPEQLERYSRTGAKIVLFNDLGKEYSSADLMICPQILRKYPNVGKDQRLLSGPKYFIVREEFKKLVDGKLGNSAQHKKNICITLGGCLRALDANRILPVLRGLVDHNLRIEVLTGFDSTDILKEALSCGVLNSNHITLKAGSRNPAAYMSGSVLALASSGYVKYELAALGVPMVLVSIVDHQRELGRVFCEQSGAGEFFDGFGEDSPDKLVARLADLFYNECIRASMSSRGRELVDCRGSERVVAAILE